MKKCHIAYLACTAALVGTGLGAAPTAAGHTVHLVKPGESIQKAVDAAEPGDTVLLALGVYHESVTLSTPGLTLRGMGRRTVLEPAADAAKAAGTCAADGNGICVVGTKDHRVEDVTVAALTVSGFTRNGVWATATDRLTVRNVTAVKNGGVGHRPGGLRAGRVPRQHRPGQRRRGSVPRQQRQRRGAGRHGHRRDGDRAQPAGAATGSASPCAACAT